MNNGIKIAAITLGVLGITAFTSTQVLAQQTGETTFVTALAQKLGIDQAKVQTAVDEVRADRRSEMQAKFNEKLDQAVKDGKLTEAQKQLILQKHQEVMNKKENFKDLTPEQRREAMQKHRQELETWASENNIDLQYLKGHMGGRGHMGGFKGDWGK